MLFREAGAQNLKVSESEANINIGIKPFLLTKEIAAQYEEKIDLLNRYIISGKTQKCPGGLLINSNVKSVHDYVDESLKNDLLGIAEKEDMTLEELVEKILRDGVTVYHQRKG